MLVSQLQRIQEFHGVEPQELGGVAARARIVCLPARRWVVQGGRDLQAFFYLLKGEVQTWQPDQQVSASNSGRLQHFYPGCRHVQTRSACQILCIDRKQHEFLAQGGSSPGLVVHGNTAWLADFLQSRMMSHLSRPHWHGLLKAFERQSFAKGECIIAQGSAGHCCYVIEQGHAAVHRQRQTLRYLNPGDFFGEDALILDTPRNAHVTALQDMVVHAIDAVSFSTWLLGGLVKRVNQRGAGTCLNVGKSPVANALPVDVLGVRESASRFDPKVSYYVVGGTLKERDLVTFVLLQRGLQAYSVSETPWLDQVSR